jgi:hypothetical protein
MRAYIRAQFMGKLSPAPDVSAPSYLFEEAAFKSRRNDQVPRRLVLPVTRSLVAKIVVFIQTDYPVLKLCLNL